MKCPKCGTKIEQFGDADIQDNEVCYNFTCPYCEFEGYVWYRMLLSGITDDAFLDVAPYNEKEEE